MNAMFLLPEPVNVVPEGPEEYVATPRRELAAMIDSRFIAHEMLEQEILAQEGEARTRNNLRRTNELQVDEVSTSPVKRFRRSDGTS